VISEAAVFYMLTLFCWACWGVSWNTAPHG